MTATQTIEGQWVIRRYGDTSSEPYVGPGTHEQILPIVQAWNRHVDHLKATQRNCAETGFYMERAEPQSASEFARSVCQPTDHQPKAEHTRSAKPGRFNSPARRAYNLRLIAARVNAGQHTAAGYLADELHADADFVRRYSSSYGKTAAAVYREQYQAEPVKSGLDVRGHHLVRVYAYTVAVLEKAAARYARTQPLLIGA